VSKETAHKNRKAVNSEDEDPQSQAICRNG